jgi:hypothetical protein
MRGLSCGSVRIRSKGEAILTFESGSAHVNPLYRTVDEERLLDLVSLSTRSRHEARDALEGWIARGLGFERTANGLRRFDPAEALNFAKALGIRGEDDYWEQHSVQTLRRLVTDLRDRAPQSISFRLERRINLSHLPRGSRTRVHLPLPPENDSSGRLVEFATVPDDGIVSVAAEITLSCHPERRRGTVTTEPLELYLRPTEGLMRTTPRVIALAKELRCDRRDAREIVRAFRDFMFEHMMLGVVHYDRFIERNVLDETLESGIFDCRVGSALVVALCRASGIPARMLSGYALYTIPFYHYWIEFWIAGEGWVPLDLISWDLSRRGRDEAWRDHFFGDLDTRMTTEILPHTFTGFPSVRFPSAWHALARQVEKGAAFGIFAAENGELIYEDTLSFNEKAAPLLP